jgi:hypothetical protein
VNAGLPSQKRRLSECAALVKDTGHATGRQNTYHPLRPTYHAGQRSGHFAAFELCSDARTVEGQPRAGKISLLLGNHSMLLNFLKVNTANEEPVLSSQEASRLHELEDIIEAGLDSFLKIGLCFAEVKFLRLHRATHATFEDYCRDRWALSLSRCNQILNTCKVFDNIIKERPQDAELLADTGEHGLRPLSRLEPELQTAAWQLVRQIEERPRGTTIEEVVDTIRNAISDGWRERAERPSAANQEPVSLSPVTSAAPASANHNGTTKDRRLAAARQSDQLGNLCRWAGRITNWDPEAIALADDELCVKRQLKAARQLRTFCEALIRALETRLLDQNPTATHV